MDPFTEKDLIDNLRSIASSLRNMDRKMDDIAMSLRELVSEDEECECECHSDSDEKIDDKS
jgi:hypothetical protein